MTNSSLQRLMRFHCDIQEPTETIEPSGQITVTYATRENGQNVKCLYIDRAQSITARSVADVLTYNFNILLFPGVVVGTKDQIVNIRDLTGAVVEIGPFSVETVARNRDIKGNPHHVYLGLERRS